MTEQNESLKPKKEEPADVGVIVGRFQVHELHQGHIDLIDSVASAHSKLIIFLGLSPVKCTFNNPLDFESRKQMILSKYPDAIVLYIKDVKGNEVWSNNLDEQITDVTGPDETVMLYGSRDSFIQYYSGKYNTCELVQKVFVSGSDIRKKVSSKVVNSPEFRTGVFWATRNRFPTAFATVDVAVLNEDASMVLLARKPNQKKYQFIGGFSEPDSMNYEQDARREVAEEAHVEVGDVRYLCSAKIDDWRYRSERDKIKTLFFRAKYIHGRPEAGDDVCEVRWFNLDDPQLHSQIVSGHDGLLTRLLEDLNPEDEKNNNEPD